jgi:hypothetical protein
MATVWMKELYDQNQERVRREGETAKSFYAQQKSAQRQDDKPASAQEVMDRASRMIDEIHERERRKENEKLWKPYIDKQKRSEQMLVEAVPSWEQVLAFL